jgi:hypothetical protein
VLPERQALIRIRLGFLAIAIPAGVLVTRQVNVRLYQALFVLLVVELLGVPFCVPFVTWHKLFPAAPGPASVGKTVYVGNLSWDTQWQDLKDHFKQVGSVIRADVMTEGGVDGGRSKVLELSSILRVFQLPFYRDVGRIAFPDCV